MAQLGGDQQFASSAPRDAGMAQALEQTAKEAQEQMHFHTSELRMWERVSNAAAAGLDALQADGQSDGLDHRTEADRWPTQSEGRF
jgi:hypothetical protein